jgi:hypothetical protein
MSAIPFLWSLHGQNAARALVGLRVDLAMVSRAVVLGSLVHASRLQPTV